MLRKILLSCLVCTFSISSVWASTPLWTAQMPEAVKWTQVTQSGILLAGTNGSLSGIDPDSGKVLWTRDDIKKSAPFNTREVMGTPILIVNDYSGWGTKTRIYAINIVDGTDIWKTEPENGYTLGVYPVPSKKIAVLFYSGWTKEEGSGIHMTAYELSSGKQLWDNKIAGSVVLHPVDEAGMFYSKNDLSGHQEPIVEGDNFYVPFLGLSCYDLNTGAVKWEVPFKTAISAYKKTYAPLQIQGDTIYASGYGLIYAIDKTAGTVKWKSEKITSAQIAELTLADNMVLARVGGFFYQPGTKKYVLDKPLRVIAYNKQTGEELWEYKGISAGLTNLLYVPSQKEVVFADGEHLIGVDSESTGKATEKFKVKMEFTRNIGGSELASAGMKVLTAPSLGGLLHAGAGLIGSKKNRMDVPVNVALMDDGHVAVRGKQHVMNFDPVASTMLWSNYFPAPGAGMFEIAVMSALTFTASVGYQGGAASGTMSASSASDGIKDSWARFDQMNTKRFEASKGSQKHAFILTQVDDAGKKGLGIIAVNFSSGEPDQQFLFGEKQPVYTIDEVEGKLFHFKGGKNLEAYSLSK